LLAGGRELALVNLFQATGADIATITECKIPEVSGEFSVACYTTFARPPSAGGKTRVLVLVENGLAVRANVKVLTDIMDPAVQSVWYGCTSPTTPSAATVPPWAPLSWAAFTGSGHPCLTARSPCSHWRYSFSRSARRQSTEHESLSTATTTSTWTGQTTKGTIWGPSSRPSLSVSLSFCQVRLSRHLV
jgi:hypothetical protein